MPSRLIIATTNPHKLREIRGLLGGGEIVLAGLGEFPPIAEPEETGRTFQENARLKALYYSRHLTGHREPDVLVVAEDSGLVVDALDGEPGVRSARFLRSDASYEERFAEIFRLLDRQPERPRSARFVCALAAVLDDRVVFETTGTVDGEITDAPQGSGGFGYDPIFHYPPYGRTFAEVSEAEKLRVAHRGKAFRQLGDWLRTGEAPRSAPEL